MEYQHGKAIGLHFVIYMLNHLYAERNRPSDACRFLRHRYGYAKASRPVSRKTSADFSVSRKSKMTGRHFRSLGFQKNVWPVKISRLLGEYLASFWSLGKLIFCVKTAQMTTGQHVFCVIH
jgi:hypothetical protein